MAFQKGSQKVGGRKAGTPNKVTQNARAVIATLLDNNAEKMQIWLDEIYAKDGALAAFRCFAYLLEFHVPKLSRAELTDNSKHKIEMNLSITPEQAYFEMLKG